MKDCKTKRSYANIHIPGFNKEEVEAPEFSKQRVVLTATVGNDTYTFTKSFTFMNSKYYEINVKMNKTN